MKRRKHALAELDQDIRDHIERETDDNIARGMSPDEARNAAIRKFGNITRIKEDARNVWILRGLEQLWQDVKFGARMLRKSPGFTIVAVLTLALGIGMNCAVFGMIYGLLFCPAQVSHPESFVVFNMTNPMGGRRPATPVEFSAWMATGAFQELSAEKGDSLVMTGRGEPRNVSVELTSPNYFRVLGVAPLLGRTFNPDEDASKQDHEAILGYIFWRTEFASDPNVLGKTIRLSNTAYTVIGVMPLNYTAGLTDFWIPANLSALSADPEERQTGDLYVKGRLKNGLPLEQAQTEISTAEGLLGSGNSEEKGWMAAVEIPRGMGVNSKPFLYTLLAIAFALLLIASLNLAGIFLARCTKRRSEFAVRAALGASRWRAVRQLLAESLLLALAGGITGAAMLLGGGKVLAVSAGVSDKQWIFSGMGANGPVLLCAACSSLLAVLLFGLAPAIESSKVDLSTAMKDAGRAAGRAKRHRITHTIVVLQVTLALVLTVTTGTLTRIVLTELHGSRGFNENGLLAVNVSTWGPRYSTNVQKTAFFHETIARVRRLPGVAAAAATADVPVDYEGVQWTSFEPSGQIQADPLRRPEAISYVVTPDYFHTMEIPLLRGRSFSDADHAATSKVAIIGSLFAKEYFPHGDAMGAYLRLFGPLNGATVVGEVVRVVGIAETWRLTRMKPRQPSFTFHFRSTRKAQ